MEFSPRAARGALTMVLAGLGMSSALALAPRAAAAQMADTTHALVYGRRSIAVSLPEGGGPAFEVWRMRSETLNRGLILRLNADLIEEDRDGANGSHRSISLLAGPAFRRYVGPRRPVAPFVQTTLLAGGWYRWSNHAIEGAPTPTDPWGLTAAARFGVGAEWFPHRSVSLNAHTGAGVNATYLDESSADVWRLGLSTFTSALALQIYF